MKIAFWGNNSPIGYSGGRYHAWIMAEALASHEHEVRFITNSKPGFADDFKNYPSHNKIAIYVSPVFERDLPDLPADLLVVVPHLEKESGFFDKARSYARRLGARLVLLNFEAGNWFNRVSPFKKDLSLWKNWRDCCQDGCLVLSQTKIGDRFARSFYVDYPDRTSFAQSYPSINTLVADAVPDVTREKRILIMARFSDPHKGSSDVLKVICPEMREYTLVFVVGTGAMSLAMRNALRHRVRETGCHVEFLHQLSDEGKFREIKRAELTVFPSYFEGYGYPPVESLYCGTPCVCYDLPVLREVSGKALTLVPKGNHRALQKAIAHHLHSSHSTRMNTPESVKRAASFSRFADDLDRILTNYIGASSNVPQPRWVMNPNGLAMSFGTTLQEMADQLAALDWNEVSILGAGKNGILLYGLLATCNVNVRHVYDDHETGVIGRHTIQPFADCPTNTPLLVAMSSLHPNVHEVLERIRSTGIPFAFFG